MTNILLWDANLNTGGTWLRAYADYLDLAVLERVAGYKATGNHAYHEPERGYDGWELYGTFNGAVFSLYTRWGALRIGGGNDLDVDGLLSVLTSLR